MINSCNLAKNKATNSNSDIIEANRIDNYSLTLTKFELDHINNVIVDTIEPYLIYKLPNIKIWYDTNKDSTSQICAYNDYSGKFRNTIGINDSITSLTEIEKFDYDKIDQVYQFNSIKGICFNVQDNQLELDTSQQTITAICIYKD